MSGGEGAELIDSHGRKINYLRLAVTDRCNLRCFYCMPAIGIKYLPKKELLSFEENIRLVSIFSDLGVNKLRFTGGEPFLRKDFIDLVKGCNEIEGIREMHLTTNGVLTEPHIPALKDHGIDAVNLSLDSVNQERFKAITRYDELDKVLSCFQALVHAGIQTKINAVVMKGRNEEDLIPLARMAFDHPVDVRFIEEMPFKGEKEEENYGRLRYIDIYNLLEKEFPGIKEVDSNRSATARQFVVPGFKGKLGIIPAFSRTFCGSCNRLRLTSQGMLKTCLYGDNALDLRFMLRNNARDEEIKSAISNAVARKHIDGFAAESHGNHSDHLESMSTIGG